MNTFRITSLFNGPHRFLHSSFLPIPQHIDCAWVYENEKEVGEALQEAFKAGILKREELFVTSKLWNTFHKKDEVRRFWDSLCTLWR